MATSRRRSLGALALLSVVSLAAVGCGSDDDSSSDTTAAAATTAGASETTAATETTGAATETSEAAAAEPTGSPITIGLLFAETGPSSSAYKTTKAVAEAWAEWVNTEKGGVGGHPIEIAAADSKGEAAAAQAAVQQLVEADGAVAIIIQDTASEVAASEYLSGRNIPVIGGSANSTAANTKLPNYLTMATTNPALSASGVIAAQASGSPNMSAVVCAEVPTCAQAGELYNQVSQSVGIDYLGVVTVAATEPDFTAACLQQLNEGSEWIQLGLASATALRVIESCNRQGFTGTYGATSNSVVEDDFASVPGMRLGGGINGFPWWADDPLVEEFRTAVEEYQPGTAFGNSGATTTWAALELFRKTMADAPAEVTSADVMTAYGTIKDETLDGLLPQPLTFTAGQPAPPVNCFWPFLLEDGEFATLDAGTPSGNGAEGDLKTACFPPAT